MTDAAALFRQFVLKVHSRCNLACTYCYLYQGPDTTWRNRPVRVTESTMRRTSARIAEHLERHELPVSRIDLHGGEPLLSGVDPILRYAAAIREMAPPGCELSFFVQTNGTLLGPAAVRQLADSQIRVGLSLDGGSADLNHRRTDHAGRSSWPAVSRAARLLMRQPEAYAGILCTIDVRQDPLATYESLLALAPPALDFLLPHANWASPPTGVPAPGPPMRTPRAAPYGEWLAQIFDRWWDVNQLPTRIRLFEEVIALLLGAPSATESLGHSPAAAVVVETDGAIERVDSLRSAYEGASAIGCDVYRHDFDQVRDRLGPGPSPSATCRGCPVFRVCGGGNLAHRYDPRSGFHNPSVYCADLELLIRHIALRLQQRELSSSKCRCMSAK